MTIVDKATAALEAFARSDIERARDLCAEGVVLFGTDAGEVWRDRESFLAALNEMRALGLRARWRETPIAAANWVAGEAEFRFPDGTAHAARVTMVFADDKLVHAHYSFASEVTEPAA